MSSSFASKIDTDKPFGVVPKFVFEETDASAAALGLYSLLCAYANHEGFCYPAVPTLAATLNVTDRTVQNWLKKLQLCGLLIISRRPGQSSLLQVIRRRDQVLKLTKVKEQSIECLEVVKRTSPPTKSSSPEVVKQSSPKHNNPNNTKIQKIEINETNEIFSDDLPEAKHQNAETSNISQSVREAVVKKLGGAEEGWELAMELESYGLYEPLLILQRKNELKSVHIKDALKKLKEVKLEENTEDQSCGKY